MWVYSQALRKPQNEVHKKYMYSLKLRLPGNTKSKEKNKNPAQISWINMALTLLAPGSRCNLT